MTSTLSRAIVNYPNRFDPAVLAELPDRLQQTIRRRDQVLGPGYTLIKGGRVGPKRGKESARIFGIEGAGQSVNRGQS
jgi:hypothetical protein